MARKSKTKRPSKTKNKAKATRKSRAKGAATAVRKQAKKRKTGGQPGRPHGTVSNSSLMPAPSSGVKVRMYRQGHGDCFLLAFRGEQGPVYVLIDCGYKPGSSVHADISAIVDHIAASTGNRIDLAIITHEHQDHVNGFWKKGIPYFDKFNISEAWFAWTECPDDKLANDLRNRHHDQLLGLVGARNRLAAGGAETELLDNLLSLEFGIDNPAEFAAANKDPAASINKQGMKLIKDKATKKNTKYIFPHKEIMTIPGVNDVRVFAFGPPHDADLIADEDPQGSEAFPGHAMSAYASFYAAAKGDDQARQSIQPIANRFSIPLNQAFRDAEYGGFFRKHYGTTRGAAVKGGESPDDAAWRRIDQDWLYSAEDLALSLNKGINNTSLVLAFELQRSKKVLLFVGDAQRGNWISWTKGSWKDRGESITVRDLMSRTVLYKVGHHGSHNATLHGTDDDEYASLSWMAKGKFASEFTAMITAVPKWALAQHPPWRHPLPSIKKALLEKTGGRVFQTDTDTVAPLGPPDQEWRDFESRVTVDPNGLFFDYDVHD
jgi:hypothetical protein